MSGRYMYERASLERTANLVRDVPRLQTQGRDNEKAKEGAFGARMTQHSRKFLLVLSGQTGAQLITVGTLVGTLLTFGSAVPDLSEMTAAAVLIRFVAAIFRGPHPVLPAPLVRKQTKQVIADELRLTITLGAGCYVMHWPVELTVFSLFALFNFTVQLGFFRLSRRILKHLARTRADATPSACDKRVIIVGTGPIARKAADAILEAAELCTSLAGFLDFHKTGLWRYRDIPLLGHPDTVAEIIARGQMDAMIIAVEPQDLSLSHGAFRTAEQMGVPVCIMPEVFEPSICRPRAGSIDGVPVMVYRAVPENQSLLLMKNLIDKIGALCGLMLAAPVMFITAIAIKLDSRGPIFFKQIRAGVNGKPFSLYKFRTMCNDAEKKKASLAKLNEMSGPVFKIKDDPRVTRVGRLLRKTSIDEIPQFINILKGEMSLVGPRPALPKEVALYEPWQRRKLAVKPGVTCIWQVSGRNRIDFEDWMRLDLEYIDNWSLWLDTKIIAKTVPAVIKGSGAS